MSSSVSFECDMFTRRTSSNYSVFIYLHWKLCAALVRAGRAECVSRVLGVPTRRVNWLGYARLVPQAQQLLLMAQTSKTNVT